MRQNKINGIRVGSSDHKKRMRELQENHERLQEMLKNGWQIESVRVKRPRIHREPTPKRIKVQVGFVEIIVEFADWQAHGSVGKIVEKYY